jgi:hypothetical protein
MGTSFNPPVPQFLTPEEKEEWFKTKKPFEIVGVKSGEGRYGIGHTYELQYVDNKTGEVITRYITMKSNARRDIEAEWIKEQLAESPSVGPVRLEKVLVKDQTNPAWAFVAVD